MSANNGKNISDDSKASSTGSADEQTTAVSAVEEDFRQRPIVLVLPAQLKYMGYACVLLLLFISVLSYLNTNMMIDSRDSIGTLTKENGELLAVFNRILYSLVTANVKNAGEDSVSAGEADPQRGTYAAE